MRKEFKRGKLSSFCPFRTFRTGEKYLVFHVLLRDQKYQKSSKRFPLRNLPVSSRFAEAQTIYTLWCEHIEQTVRLQIKARVQAQMHRLSARLCFVPCRCGRGACLGLCQRTDFVHARHTLICGRGFSHTRICSALSCDVFARVV